MLNEEVSHLKLKKFLNILNTLYLIFHSNLIDIGKFLRVKD